MLSVSFPVFGRLDLHPVALIDDKSLRSLLRTGVFVRMFDDVVAREAESIDRVDVDDARVGDAERVALNEDVAVVACTGSVRDAAADGDAGGAPRRAAVVAVLSEVATDHHIAHARLFEPVVGIPLEEDRRTGDVEVVVLDDDPPA